MALNDIIFQKQNGGMGRTAANEDPVSGLLLGLNAAIANDSDAFNSFDPVAVGQNTLHIATLKYVEQLSANYGINHTDNPATDEEKAQNFIDYQVRQFFAMSPEGTLYLAVKLSGEILPDEISALQMYASGKLRQVGIAAAGTSVISAEQITGYQTEAETLESNHMPLSVVVALRKGNYTSIADLTSLNLVLAGRQNVSVFVSRDLDATLVSEQNAGNLHELAAIGLILGAVSLASVNESIAWVQKFPLDMKKPGFVTGELLKETTVTNLNLLNDNHLIFVREHVGASKVYFNDSHTLDVATSDYAYIENVRTMDKATRGIRSNLLPYLNSPLKVDATTGKLSPDTVAYLETVAGRALEDMEKADELSGYEVIIDPEQNVLATSELEVIVHNVPMGVMRKVKVKIGYTQSLS